MLLDFKNSFNVKKSFQHMKMQTKKQYAKFFGGALLCGLTGMTLICTFFPLNAELPGVAGVILTMLSAVAFVLGFISSLTDRIWAMPVSYAQMFSTLFFKHTPFILSSHDALIAKECEFRHYKIIKAFFDFFSNYKLQIQHNIPDSSDLKEIKSLIDFNILSFEQKEVPLKVKTLIKENHLKIFEACDKALQEMYTNRKSLDLVDNDLDQETILFELNKQEQKAKEFIANIYEKMPKHTQEQVVKHNKHLAI